MPRWAGASDSSCVLGLGYGDHMVLEGSASGARWTIVGNQQLDSNRHLRPPGQAEWRMGPLT